MPTTSPAARRRLAVGLGLTILAAACTGGDDDAAPTTTMSPTTTTIVERVNDGVLKVGAYLPLTGPGAAFGPPMIDALSDAVDVINAAGGVLGEEVEFIQRDEGAVAIEELLAEGVDAIVGPASSLVALSSLGAAVDQSTGVVTCSPMATALALDDYPDRGDYFFRTAPSDSLQMLTIARQAERTGAQMVAVGYLDDPYGRGLEKSFDDAMGDRLPVMSVGFSADQDDLSGVAAELLAEDPAVVVVLGDADDGSRLLAALDATNDSPQVLINDSIRQARAVIQSLSPAFRDRLTGHAPLSESPVENGPPGFFVGHAVDCLNLIALAVMDAGSDDPSEFRRAVSAVSAGGRRCTGFESCAASVQENFEIDYNGFSGPVDLSAVTGDPVRALFETFQFDDDGNEIPRSPIDTSS